MPNPSPSQEPCSPQGPCCSLLLFCPSAAHGWGREVARPGSPKPGCASCGGSAGGDSARVAGTRASSLLPHSLPCPPDLPSEGPRVRLSIPTFCSDVDSRSSHWGMPGTQGLGARDLQAWLTGIWAGLGHEGAELVSLTLDSLRLPVLTAPGALLPLAHSDSFVNYRGFLH